MPAPTFAPVPKITAAGSAGFAAVALIWYARTLFGVDMPEDVAMWTVFAVTLLAGYLKSDEPFRVLAAVRSLFARNDPKAGRHVDD